MASKIVQGIYELDFAKNLHQDRLQATKRERQQILNAKLKPKGILLNDNNNQKKPLDNKNRTK